MYLQYYYNIYYINCLNNIILFIVISIIMCINKIIFIIIVIIISIHNVIIITDNVTVTIIFILFERGAFLSEDTFYTAQVLSMFALGLPAYILIKVLITCYFSREDTKTPLYISIFYYLYLKMGCLVCQRIL